MSLKISRNDVYIRDEKGPEWFEDFLRSLAQQSTTQNILDAINKKRGETVEGVVSKYRAMVGLDALADDDKTEIQIKSKALRPISVRHAKELDKDKKDVVVIIESDPKLKADFESILKGSGGTKNTHAILHFLRGLLGSDLVSYSDDHLIQYIDEMKKKYVNTNFEEPSGNAGRVGTEPIEEFNDHAADFMGHGKGK